MNEEVYIPITPATRIPFPCWLYGHFRKFVGQSVKWDYFVNKPCGAGHFTHYCTSATMPTGRPGEEDDGKAFRKKFVATLEGSTQDASTTVPTGRPEELQGPTEDGYANYHDSLSSPAVPTASGATGPSMEQRKEWHQPCLNQTEALSRIQTLIRRLRYRGDDYNADIAEMELLPFLSASRPAVAQEWVRDAERLDWLQENAHPKWGNESSFEVSHVHLCICAKTGVYELPKPLRAAIDAAMSSQPEGRG